MNRLIVCLFLTLSCALGSYISFMSNDYGPLTHWMAYYREYKEIKGALDKGSASKAEMLAKLKAMYPEKADQIEAQFRAKYGNLKDSAEDAGKSVKSKWSSYSNSSSQSRSSQSQSSSRSTQSQSRSSQDTQNRQSSRSTHDSGHDTDVHDNNRR